MSDANTKDLTCSPREAAEALGISVRTAQLWVEEGRLSAWKTPGGHRRILRASVDRLMEQQKQANRPHENTLCILLLDDDHAHRDMLEAQIRQSYPGAQLRGVKDTYEFFMHLGAQTPDMLLIDLGSVNRDNGRLIETISRNPRVNQSLLVILADATETLEEDFLPNDALIVKKPAEGEEILRLIRAFLQGSNRRS